MYDTAGRIACNSEYGCDMYYNALESDLSNTTSCEETIFHVIAT